MKKKMLFEEYQNQENLNYQIEKRDNSVCSPTTIRINLDEEQDFNLSAVKYNTIDITDQFSLSRVNKEIAANKYNKHFLMNTDELYSRPGKIRNKKICTMSEEGTCKLRENMNLSYDYFKVNNQVWKYLKAWYGCDFEILL